VVGVGGGVESTQCLYPLKRCAMHSGAASCARFSAPEGEWRECMPVRHVWGSDHMPKCSPATALVLTRPWGCSQVISLSV
jgi:hypothetical protein